MKLKITSKIGAALVAAFALSSVANAAYITGTMGFGGGNVTMLDSLGNPTTDATAARGLDFSQFVIPGPFVVGPRVTTASGDFVPVLGEIVNFDQDPWMFDPLGTGDLWTVGIFTFDVSSVVYSIGLDNSLTVSGDGLVSGGTFTPTQGHWTLTTQPDQNNTLIAWSSAAATVPDGGTTVALLGLSLLGLHGARRKFSKH